MILKKYRKIMTMMVREETPIGNQTGAIHGTGIRNRTSIVLRVGGHLIKI